MADYIYLLQNRFTPAQRKAVDAVRDAARVRGVTVFLVGGAVRDLSSGTPVRDLDFAVQGDVSAIVDDLTAGGAIVAGKDPVLSSSHLIFPGGIRAEVGPTLTVTYPKPGQPETQPAAILDDLRRRDFTANAMAISLNEGSFGLLLDPLNGIADMENRELRLVSNYGFIEQPALLLRAARLSERLGWTLEERTQGRYATAKEENYIAALPARDRGFELEEIFHEEDPLAALAHLNDEGWGEILSPAWTEAKADRDGLDRVRDLMGQMEQMGIHADPSPVFFPLLTAKLSQQDSLELKASFARPGFVQQIDQLEGRSKDLASQMTSKSASAPSDVWRLLFAAEPEVVLWLAYSSRSSAVQAKFRAFLNEWPQMRQRIPYGLMQEMRITPDLPGYDKLLDDLFFALIDGKLGTVEATRAFLEPFSPPAPAPQVSPRRRPAKATRSRSKKAVAKLSASDDTADEPETDSETDSQADLDADSEADEDSTSSPAEVAPGPSARAEVTGVAKAASTGKKSAATARSETPASTKVSQGKSEPKQAGFAAAAPAKAASKAAVAKKEISPPAKLATKGTQGSADGAPAPKKSAAIAGLGTASKAASKETPVKEAAVPKDAPPKAAIKVVVVKAPVKAPESRSASAPAAAKKHGSTGKQATVPEKSAPTVKESTTKGRSGK
ncbi:MAG: hypothetical protein ACRYFU_12240 [Janthinobacterium lividum]